MKRGKRGLSALLLLIILLYSFVGAMPAYAADSPDPEGGAEALLVPGTLQTYHFTVPQEGNYELSIKYQTQGERSTTPQATVSLTGPSEAAYTKTVDLPRMWVMAEDSIVNGRFEQDDSGNELAPSYRENQAWQTMRFFVTEDVLPAGEYTLTVDMIRESVKVRDIRLLPVADVPTYDAYIQKNDAAGAKDVSCPLVMQEAELADKKSHLEITVNYDRTSPAISPNDPVCLRYNLLGGSQFGIEGQWVSWTIDVPETGYYELDFVYRQNLSNGLSVLRKLYIDDTVPFEECSAIRFPYSDAIKTYTLADDKGEAYRFFLTAGTHTVRMEVVLTGLQDILSRLNDVVSKLNLLYSNIMVLVGETPDAFRDYNLVENVAGLTDTLSEQITELEALQNELQADGTSKATLADAARVLRTMLDKPRNIPKRMDQFRTQINALADLTAAIRSQPLELDYFVFRAPDADRTSVKTSFWELIKYRIAAFCASFFADYNAIGLDSEGKKPIKVWVSANELTTFGFAVGRDQAQIINLLATEDFVPQTGIPVRISLIDPSTLIPAMISGKGPDAVLFVPKETLSGLYYRNALVDLTQMEGFEQIRERFTASSLISLGVNGKIFALPEVQNYSMMFYRTDIFRENDLQPPDTWTQFYTVLNRLQKKSMQVGIPALPQTYEMLLLQNGGTLYNEDISKTNMTSPESVAAFTQWTELYTKHGLLVAYDALSRFRSGQMPLLITQGYFYGQLSIGAPEIAGRWAMKPIPATQTDKGNNRSQASMISGAAVLHDADQQAAFRFIDWWTSDETQQRFAFENESKIGVSGRYFPANKAAFESLSWTVEESNALREQWNSVSDNPQSPATYYVTRNLNNAYRRSVYSAENPRDVIYRYGQMVDSELARKRAELGLD